MLKPYKAIITRWVYPDVVDDQDISVSKAKKAASDYRKAVGSPEGIAELSVYYCETCIDFLDSCGMDDEEYFHALVGMFEKALKAVVQLDGEQQLPFVERLESVQREGHNYGYWVGDDMDRLMAEYGFGEK